jgi:hypothetical protein
MVTHDPQLNRFEATIQAAIFFPFFSNQANGMPTVPVGVFLPARRTTRLGDLFSKMLNIQ